MPDTENLEKKGGEENLVFASTSYLLAEGRNELPPFLTSLHNEQKIIVSLEVHFL